MARRRGQRRRGGVGINNSAGVTRQVNVVLTSAKAIGKDLVDWKLVPTYFPGLKTVLGGCQEWRVLSASAEYSSIDPSAKGLVALAVAPDAWQAESVAGVTAIGGVQFPASAARRVTPSRGGFSTDYNSTVESNCAVFAATLGVSGDVGYVTVRATLSLRGISM